MHACVEGWVPLHRVSQTRVCLAPKWSHTVTDFSPPTFENLRVSAVLFFFLSYYVLFILCVYEGYMCMPHYAGGGQRATGM